MDDSTALTTTCLLISALVGVSLALGQVYLASRPSPFDRVAVVSTAHWAQHRSFPDLDRLATFAFP